MNNVTPEQRAAIRSIDRDQSVMAGAGTGKTHVLVQRFLHVLERRPEWPLRSVVAITFTKAAALSMRQRIRREMNARACHAPGVWRPRIAELDSLQVTTVHSFCQRLLTEHAVEAGIDPDFEVADEIRAASLRAEAVRRYSREIDGTGLPEVELVRIFEPAVFRQVLADLLTKEHLLGRHGGSGAGGGVSAPGVAGGPCRSGGGSHFRDWATGSGRHAGGFGGRGPRSECQGRASNEVCLGIGDPPALNRRPLEPGAGSIPHRGLAQIHPGCGWQQDGSGTQAVLQRGLAVRAQSVQPAGSRPGRFRRRGTDERDREALRLLVLWHSAWKQTQPPLHAVKREHNLLTSTTWNSRRCTCSRFMRRGPLPG